MKNILFPFQYDANFKGGYSWSMELSKRLKAQLSIFATLPDHTLEYFSQLYHELILAREYHVRAFGGSSSGRKTHPVLRNFLKGDFETTFLHFIQDKRFDLIVLPEGLVSERLLQHLILSQKHIIVLQGIELAANRGLSQITSGNFFVESLHTAACYNLPASFYKTVSEDQTLFNSIASFFKKQEFSI